MAKKENNPLTKRDLKGIEKSINNLDGRISKLEERFFDFEVKNEKSHQDLQSQIDEKFNKVLTNQDKIIRELQAIRQESIFSTFLYKEINKEIKEKDKQVEEKLGSLEIRVKKLEEKFA